MKKTKTVDVSKEVAEELHRLHGVIQHLEYSLKLAGEQIAMKDRLLQVYREKEGKQND